MTTGSDIARTAADWKDVPWRHLGRDRSGVDCIGLGLVVFRELDLLPQDFDVRNYSRTPNGHEFVRELVKAGFSRWGGEKKPGMLCTMKIGHEPMHLGFFGPGGTVIHADSRDGVGAVVVHRLDAKWNRRITSVWIFPDVDY